MRRQRKTIADKATYRAPLHPDFKKVIDENIKLIYWWGTKLARIFNRSFGIFKYHQTDFIGYLTIRMNYMLHHYEEDKGSIAAYFGANIVRMVLSDIIYYDMTKHDFDFFTEDDRNESLACRAYHENGFNLYRLPDELSEEWVDEIFEMFDTPNQIFDYLTDGMPERVKTIILFRFRDDLTLRQIGELMDMSYENVRLIEMKTLRSIANKILAIEKFRCLFSDDVLNRIR